MTKPLCSSCRGFTLIELIVTMAVLAILVTVGVPGLSGFVVSSRIGGQANEILAGLNLARGEAVRRNQRVIFCPVTATAEVPNTAACANPGSGSWQGWMVFADANSNGAREAGEELLRAATLGGGSTQVRASAALSGANNRIVFRPDGIAKAHGGLTIQQVTLRVCDTSGTTGQNLRDVVMTFGSRTSVVRGNEPSCATPANPS